MQSNQTLSKNPPSLSIWSYTGVMEKGNFIFLCNTMSSGQSGPSVEGNATSHQWDHQQNQYPWLSQHASGRDRQEVFVVESYVARHASILFPEGFGQGLQQGADLDEAVQLDTRIGSLR